MQSLFRWMSAAAPAQPLMLLYQESARWCSWGGSRRVKFAPRFRSRPLPPAPRITSASCYKWKTRTGRKDTKEGGKRKLHLQALCERGCLHKRADFRRLGFSRGCFHCIEASCSLLPGSLKRAQYWQRRREPCCGGTWQFRGCFSSDK